MDIFKEAILNIIKNAEKEKKERTEKAKMEPEETTVFKSCKLPPEDPQPDEKIEVDLEPVAELIKTKMVLTLLEAMGMGDKDEAFVFIKILLRNGCPVDAVLKSFSEMAQHLEERAEDDE